MIRIKIIMVVAALLAFGGPASAQVVGIRNSAHDLSNSSATATLKNQDATHNQLCIYCHTPHKAQSTALLWNHAATVTTSWNWGNDLDGNAMTRSSAGTNLPTTLRSSSKRCLGCHDGTVAVGDMSNIGGGFAGVMGGLANVASETDADGKLINSRYLVGASGNLGGNHPVSVPYAGETGYNSIDSAVAAAQVGPSVLGGYYNVVVGASCLSPTGVCTSAPASDGRNGAAVNLIPNVPGGTTNVGVECSSCHEPHNKFGYAAFARVDVANASGLCRSCHNK
jgi:hypothetical protein